MTAFLPSLAAERGFVRPLLCSLGIHGLLLLTVQFFPTPDSPPHAGVMSVRIVFLPVPAAAVSAPPRRVQVASPLPVAPTRQPAVRAPLPQLPAVPVSADTALATIQQPPAASGFNATADNPPLPAAATVATDSAGAPGAAAGTNGSAAAYLSQLRERIEACRDYPLLARKGHQQGRAVVRFRIDRQGNLVEAWLAIATGHRLLDRAALQAVHDAAPFPPPQQSALRGTSTTPR